jgi:hypothetical protein
MSMKDYIRVEVHGVPIYTTLEDIAECLEELDQVILAGTAENADLNCVFKALNYLKRYRSRDSRIVAVVKAVEGIIREDLERGRIQLW